MSDAYEGGDCQVPYTSNIKAMEIIKPNYNLTFHNGEGNEVGRMDFNGPGLAFEGVAEESAIVFMTWISQIFMGRLKEEYDRGFKEGKEQNESNQ